MKIDEGFDYTKLIEESEYRLLNYPPRELGFKLKNRIKKALHRDYVPSDMLFWPNGLLLRGLMSGKRSDALLRTYFDMWIAKRMPVKVVDDAISGEALVYLYQKTKEEKYRKGAKRIYEFLIDSRVNEEGSLVYRPSQKNNYVLADMVGMVCPFLCLYAEAFEVPEATGLATKQLEGFLRHGIDEYLKLPYHGYELTAEGTCVHGMVGWGRAVGWLMQGMGYYLSHAKGELFNALSEEASMDSGYMYILREYEKLALRVLECVQDNGLLGWEIIARNSHVDTSGTALMLDSVLEVLRGEVSIDSSLKIKLQDFVQNAVEALKKRVNNGMVLDSEAECQGFGLYPQQYGCYPWGQGSVLTVIAKTTD